MAKEVKLNPERSNEIGINQCCADKYYGGISYTGEKFVITRTDYMRGPYKLFCLDGLTRGNGYNFCSETSLIETIKLSLETRVRFTIFMFDSVEELFNWLAR